MLKFPHRLRLSSFVAALGALLLFPWSGPLSAADRPPNIVYIMTDDLGYGDLGCYGQEVVRTPHIDRLASEGMRFTDHYAGHTVCRPSRLVLWTGKHVGHTGLIGNRDFNLTGTENTVSGLLQDAGYATGGVGKWALGHVETPSEADNPGHPNHNGFDFWFGYLNQSRAHNFYPTHLFENMRPVPLPGNVLLTGDERARGNVSQQRETYSHDEMTEAALGFIRENSEQPFLLHVHWTIPHANNEGGRVLGNGMEVPDHGPYADEDWPEPEKGFAAMMTRMDGDVGRMVSLLAELGLEEDTLILFTSDNGPHQEGEHKVDFFDSFGPLRGYKRSMHEGGIRVPLIAKWPGRVNAGSVTDHPSAAWDFLPTACEIAGVEPPKDIDGLSYLPTLLGRGNQAQHDHLYWASSEGETSAGMRRGKWKLVRYRTDGKGRGSRKKAANTPAAKKRQEKTGGLGDWRLYDLDEDIHEDHDLAAEHPGIVSEMLATLFREGHLDEDGHPRDGGARPLDRREKKSGAPVQVALVGDSTVTDSAGWGKAFAERLGNRAEVSNFAAGGRSAKSWLAEDRLSAALASEPDYVFIQFGHNGQPGKGPERETDPDSTYRELLRKYVREFRLAGAVPVLVSSVTRRDFTGEGKIRVEVPTEEELVGGALLPLRPWAEAARAVAAETRTPFVDLYAKSVALHNEMGPETSAAFDPKEGDITHFNAEGAAAIADLVVEELRDSETGLVELLGE